MSLIAVKISKCDAEFIAELNEDYHNGDCIILKDSNLTMEELPNSFDYIVIDTGEYMFKICSPVLI